MITIGLDISTKNSGYSVFEDNKLIDYGAYSDPSSNVFKRIKNITAKVAALLDKYRPNKIIIEDILPASVGNNIDVYKKLTYIQGFIVNEIVEKGIPYELVVASHWRKKAGLKTGKNIQRVTLKQESIDKVKEQFNITTADDDIADAILIGWSGGDS